MEGENLHFGFGSRLSVQAMKRFQRKDDQVTDCPFVICFHECLGFLGLLKPGFPLFFLLLLEASQKNFVWGAQGFCHLPRPGPPSFLEGLEIRIPTAEPVSEQGGGD